MAGRDDSVTWLRVKDEDIDEAEQLRVTVSAVEEGKGKKKRKRYQCKVILHGSSKEEAVVGFKRFAATLKADPRLCGDAQRDLKQKSLADFRKQKRRREDDNLVDSEEGDGKRLCFSPSPLLHSYAAPVSLSPHTGPYAHSHCPLLRIACLGLLR